MPGFLAISQMAIADVVLLIALGVGYLVIFFAKKEEKWLRAIGYIIGVIIIISATIYLLGNCWLQSRFCRMHRGRMFKHMMQQPPMMQPKTAPQTSAPQGK